MKLFNLALGIALVGASSLTAAPYYVGENLNAPNNVTLGFQDTPVKDTATTSGQSANIAAIELKGSYMATETVGIRGGLPFYFSSEDLTGTSRNALGNISLGFQWVDTFTSSDKQMNYGYTLGADLYGPTSRKVEGGSVALANPTTELFKYIPKGTSVVPTIGLFLSQDMWSIKTNLGGGYTYVSGSGISDRNRLSPLWQTALSWHAMPNFHVNVEYNTIFLDSATRAGNSMYHHAVTPSFSGQYGNVLGNLFATLPLDSTTRDVTNVAFGANVGYIF